MGKEFVKEMEKENLQLKKLVADLSLDNAILKEVLSKKQLHLIGEEKPWSTSSKC